MRRRGKPALPELADPPPKERGLSKLPKLLSIRVSSRMEKRLTALAAENRQQYSTLCRHVLDVYCKVAGRFVSFKDYEDAVSALPGNKPPARPGTS